MDQSYKTVEIAAAIETELAELALEESHIEPIGTDDGFELSVFSTDEVGRENNLLERLLCDVARYIIEHTSPSDARTIALERLADILAIIEQPSCTAICE